MLKKLAIFSGMSLGIGVTAAVVYKLTRNDLISLDKATCNAKKEDSVKLVVSKDRVGALIGKRGATISKIREETGATITLEGEDDVQAYVSIKGTKYVRDRAVAEINKIIARTPAIVVEEIIYPYHTWPIILGTNGEKLRHLSQISKASLTVKGLGRKESFKITIQGTREEVQYIVSLIDEYLAHKEASQMNKSIGVVGKSKGELGNNNKAEEKFEKLDSDFIQVFVSAVQSPKDFWVQVFGPKSIELDKLVSEMTNFYSVSENQKSNTIDAALIAPGSLLAAVYDEDNQWYRARVTKIIEEPDKKKMADVLFVDFGDYSVLEADNLCKLRPEYLALPIQGIQCSLYGVKPTNDTWESSAIEFFKDVTYMAQWKPIMVRKADENGDVIERNIVDVIIIDTNGPKDIDIARELIKEGHALGP